MTESDYIYLNVPALLRRKALTESSNGKLVEDEDWSNRFKDRLFYLVKFFQDSDLLASRIDDDISHAVIKFSHFNGKGRKFIESGAPDRWLASFDRNPSKPPSDVSYMTKRLISLADTADGGG